MLSNLVFSFVTYAYGVAYIIFAFREPPPAVAGFFKIRIPLSFLLLLGFVPDEHRAKAGRIGVGALFILCAVLGTLRALYHFVFGWS